MFGSNSTRDPYWTSVFNRIASWQKDKDKLKVRHIRGLFLWGQVLGYHPNLEWKGLLKEKWYYTVSPMESTRSYGLQKRDQRLEASASASTLLLNHLIACVSCELTLSMSQWKKAC